MRSHPATRQWFLLRFLKGLILFDNVAPEIRVSLFTARHCLTNALGSSVPAL